MNFTTIFLNILAIIGSVLLVFGFFRVNSGKWNNKSLWYELDNVIGAILIIVYQIYYHAYVSVAVNIVWAVVAIWGIMAFFRQLHKQTRKRKRART